MSLFATFNTATSANIEVTENLINELQRQLEVARQELAAFQQQQQLELTAKGAAESALETTAKAFRAVLAAYGKEGVQEFRDALMAIVPQEPIALLASSEDDDTDPDPDNDPTPPPSGTESKVIETVEVISTTTEIVEEAPEPTTISQKEEVTKEPAMNDVQPLPSVSAIAELRKPELIKYLESYGLSTDGVVKDLKSRLTAYVISHRPLKKSAA